MFKLQVQEDDKDTNVWHDVKGADGQVLLFGDCLLYTSDAADE